MTETRFQIIERFGDSDTQDLCAEVRRLRDALGEIYLASRDDGLTAMVNWMRGRAIAALTTENWGQNCISQAMIDQAESEADNRTWRSSDDLRKE